jgi:hypothetical protein
MTYTTGPALTRALRRRYGTLVLGALLLSALALHGTSQRVGAQPVAPKPAATCQGKVNLPLGAIISPGSTLSYSASGLEASAPYTIFIGGQAVSQATTSPNGTTGGSVAVPSSLGTSLEFQIATASSCATVTLTGGSTITTYCSPDYAGFLSRCSSIAVTSGSFPTSLLPLGTLPVGTGTILFPTQNCVVPGTSLIVRC